MARTTNGPQPYYKKGRKCWYVVLPKANGGREDIRLDPDKQKAFAAFYKLMASRPAVDTGDDAPTFGATTTVREVVARFLAWNKLHRKPRTGEHYGFYLEGPRGFAANVPADLKVFDLKPFHVTKWVEKKWPTNPVNLYKAVKRPFGWARSEGYITSNPLSRLKMPSAGGRGGDVGAYIPRNEFDSILAAIKSQPFKDYCEFMYETGCRAEEINIVRTEWLRLGTNPRVVIPAELAKCFRVKKTPGPRVIYLHGRSLELATANASRNPTGTLFTNKRGRPWTACAINCGFCRLRKLLGKKYCATLFRHSFITNALLNDVNPMHVAKICSTSLGMIMRVYEHLEAESAILAASLDQATKPIRISKSNSVATAV